MNPSDALYSLFSPFLQGLLVSVGIGIMLGLEREFNTHTEETHLAGIRTFPLVSLLGYTIAVIALPAYPWVLAAATLGFSGLVAVAYFIQSNKGKLGLTTELALLLTFVLGVLSSTGLKTEALGIAVIIAILLSVKEKAHWFIRQITSEEMFAFIKFFVLALLLLPMLPNESFGPGQLLNYRDLGWIVVLVSSIGFAGYLLLKFYGIQKGVLIMALVGGLYSSTMITWLFSARSRETPSGAGTFTAGVILSSSIMFVRIILLAALFNMPLAWRLALPCTLMFAVLLLFGWIVLHREGNHATQGEMPLGNPLDLSNVALFLVLYVGVTLFTWFSRQWFGSAGALTVGAIAGLADMDAITISTAKWSAQEPAQAVGAQVILAAVLSGNIFKALICAVRGHSLMRKWVLMSFGAVCVVGLAFLVAGFWY